MSKKPVMRKYRRTGISRKTTAADSSLLLSEMFEKFMLYKNTEGLVKTFHINFWLK